MKKVLLILLGVVLLTAAAVELVTQLTVPLVVDTDDILEQFYEARNSLPPVPSPVDYKTVAAQLAEDRFDFLSSPYWGFTHTGGTLYLSDKSKLKLNLPMQLVAYEDLASGKVVLSGTPVGSKEVQTLAIVDAPEFAAYDEKTTLDKYLMNELWPRRIIWTAELRSEEDATLLSVLEQTLLSTEDTQTGMSASLAMTTMSVSETITDFRIIRDSTNLSVNLPAEFAGATITLLSCSNLINANWTTVLQTNAAGSGLMLLGSFIPESSTASGSSTNSGGGGSIPPPGGTNTNTVVSTSTTNVAAFFKTTASSQVDTDTDGLNNIFEYEAGTDYSKWDTDGDWLPDGWETTNSLDALTSDNTLDSDGDGLSNVEEYQLGTSPSNTDSDGDGVPDGEEAALGMNPLDSDTDGDGLPDVWEWRFGYDPLNAPATELSGADKIGQFDTEGYSQSVKVRNSVAYLADGTNGLKIIDVYHAGGRMLGSLSLGGDAKDLLLTNNTLWVALGAQGIAAVDVSDPFRPYQTGSYLTGGNARGLALQSNVLYVADSINGLLFLDVEYVDDIIEIGRYDDGSFAPVDVCVHGNTAWVAESVSIHELDISDLSSPSYVDSVGTSGYSPMEIMYHNTALYAVYGNLGIWNPDLGESDCIGVLSDRGARGFGVDSNRVLLAEGGNPCGVVDVFNVQNPVLIAEAVIDGYALDAALAGSKGYIAAGDTGLETIRLSTDADMDGMDDEWEILYFGSTNAVATNDFDADGICNLNEYACGINPSSADTDLDGLSDYDEIYLYASDPARADGDLDGLSDIAEIYTNYTDAGNADTDGDGMVDGWELLNGFNPLVADGAADADSDGLSNTEEYLNHTDPLQVDTDNDSLSDGWEVVFGLSPLSVAGQMKPFEQFEVSAVDNAMDVVVEGDYAYVADGTNGLVVIDVSNPALPVTVASLNTAGTSSGIAVSDGIGCVADGTNGLVIVDLSDPQNPQQLSVYKASWKTVKVVIDSDYAFVVIWDSYGDGILDIIDISAPSSPEFTGRYSVSKWVYDVYVSGSFAYIVAGNNAVTQIDVSNPSSPSWVKGQSIGTTQTPGVYGIQGNGTNIFIVSMDLAVSIFDMNLNWVSDNPGLDTVGIPNDVSVYGDRIYVAEDGCGIEVFDISDINDPVPVGQYLTDGEGNAVFSFNDHAYLADGTNGLVIFRFVEDSDNDGLADFWENTYFGDLSQSSTNDYDGDGISNWGEYLIAGNPLTNDADGDLLSDYSEIWTYLTYPLNADSDSDGRNDYAEVNGTDGVAATDPLDPDSDDDELNDGAEISWATDPHDSDTDDDNMPDGWEVENGLNPLSNDADFDADNDELYNFAEYTNGTKANNPDCDNDGLNDSEEITAGTNSFDEDSDDDGLTDGEEVNTYSSNPLSMHSDTDSMPDGWEVENGLSPIYDSSSGDLDGDGLTNEEEYQHGSKANDTDSDNDGLNDYYEVTHGLNPASSDSDGDGMDDDEDQYPGRHEIMLPQKAGFSFWCDVSVSGEWSSTPVYKQTFSIVPLYEPTQSNTTYLATNVAVNVSQVVITGYTECAAFEINDEPFAWIKGGTSFSNDVTELVGDTLGGENIAGFDLNLYFWPDHLIDLCFVRGSCFIEYEKAVPVDLVLDYDRNGVIDTNDSNYAHSSKVFRFWVNDDDDSGYDGGTDIPGDGSADGNNGSVDGVRDLIDFFPVYLDITNLLAEASYTNGYEYALCHDDGALRAVESGLTPATAGDYLRDLNTAVNLAGDATHKLGDDGWVLDEDFLEALVNDGESIILIEALKETDKPLRLELRKDGKVVGSRELPLSIVGVESMYNRVNLRDTGEYPDGSFSVIPAQNLPNDVNENKHVVFVHGYNVNEAASHGWRAEVFKRLWWSGNNAVFHGVTWTGDESQWKILWFGWKTPNYHVNVINALNTAPFLRDYINSQCSGYTVLMGHSLGNMVCGSAVARWGANVDKYLMINGAVAIENFDGSTSVQNTNMVHRDWSAYDDHLWCSEWHTLFTNDLRHELTWRNYFEDAVPVTYNFRSEGDQVFETHPANDDPGLNDTDWGGTYSWCLQEKRKGCNWVSQFGGSTYGGWGFNFCYTHEITNEYGEVVDFEQWSPGEADGISTDVLKIEPFFRPGNRELDGTSSSYIRNLYDPNNGSDFADMYQYELLAGFVPSRTLPVGRNVVGALSDRNFDMNAMQNGWPTERVNGDWGYDWRHSDIREIAYLYVYPAFTNFVGKGGLQ